VINNEGQKNKINYERKSIAGKNRDLSGSVDRQYIGTSMEKVKQ